VLDDAGKAALQAKHPNNIVTIDLPHMPPKSVGPDSAYEKANTTLKAWLSAGILVRDRRPAFYPYSQSFDHNGKTFSSAGIGLHGQTRTFGAGHIVPHEKGPIAGPIEDRFKLMKATKSQLSPVFGLFSDPRSESDESAVSKRRQADAWMARWMACEASCGRSTIPRLKTRSSR